MLLISNDKLENSRLRKSYSTWCHYLLFIYLFCFLSLFHTLSRIACPGIQPPYCEEAQVTWRNTQVFQSTTLDKVPDNSQDQTPGMWKNRPSYDSNS